MKQVIFHVDITSHAALPSLDEAIASGQAKVVPCDYTPTPAPPAPQTVRPPPLRLPAGPGTELKKLLRRVGIVATPGCSCNARAAEMDSRGCDWVAANESTVVGWLREEAAKRGLPFLDAAGKLLVRRAIANARKESERAKKNEGGQASV